MVRALRRGFEVAQAMMPQPAVRVRGSHRNPIEHRLCHVFQSKTPATALGAGLVAQAGQIQRQDALREQAASLNPLAPSFAGQGDVLSDLAAEGDGRAWWSEWLTTLAQYFRIEFDADRNIRPLLSGQSLPPATPIPEWGTLLTSMFMHGGLMHIGGNMLYLWIFGDQIEDLLGHVKFLIFYLICGFAADFAHILFNWDSVVPTLGASGAIAGVLGAYYRLFPHARVIALIPIFIFITIRELPAVFFLVLWFVLQLVQGVGSLAVETAGGGVAFFAHIGGFVAGLAFVLFSKHKPRKRSRPSGGFYRG